MQQAESDISFIVRAQSLTSDHLNGILNSQVCEPHSFCKKFYIF